MVAQRHKDRDGIVCAIGESGVSIAISKCTLLNFATDFHKRAVRCHSRHMSYDLGKTEGEEPYSEHNVSGYAVAGNEVGGVGIARS